MRIAFICGSLEPGKDGVGDYTRKLAGELIKRGCSITIISIHDKYINQLFLAILPDEKEELSIIRLPSLWDRKRRFTEAKQFIQQKNPNWVLLQYVPYGYDSSGLPLSLIPFIQSLKKMISIKMFVFFHEVSVERSFRRIKQIPLAFGQYFIAKKLFMLADQAATSIDLYAKRLSIHKKSIALIPVGSNISYFEKNQEDINKLKAQLNITNKPVIVTFGVRNHELLLQALLEVRRNHLDAHLLILGKLRGVTEIPKDILEHVTVTGFLPEEDIMNYLQASDLFVQLNNDSNGGINNKSGSLAAAFAAGLPVIGIKGKITNELLLQKQPCIFINNIKELPSSIVQFFELSDSDREQYHTRSKAFFDNYLSWEKIADQYINILNHS